MSHSHENLKNRTKQFALRVIRLATSLPPGKLSDVIQYQLLKWGTSVGANYRAACRAKSAKDFCSKMGTVEEEADESIYWTELIVDAGLIKEDLVTDLMQEANELVAITVTSINTSRKGDGRNQSE